MLAARNGERTYMTQLVERKSRRRGALSRAWRDNAGFSLLELFLICLIVGVVSAIAIFGLGTSVNAARARGATAQLKEQIANAREMAISQQRDIRIEFNDADEIKVIRINRPDLDETELLTVHLEGGMTFQKFADMPETPDAWGGDEAIAFGEAESLRFRSGDGALIDENDNFVNGRVFVGHVGGKVTSAGMVSVFGPTGRIRSYRLVGDTWDH
jgi:type II secretory pathway pseudopilin PulG